ncbi:MAG: four helix bundle protein [Longimicrobiales bacterium]
MAMPGLRIILRGITVPGARMFPSEKLEVYKLAVEFSVRANKLVPKIAKYSRSLADDLPRASESVELNIAEGPSHHAPKVKAHYFRLSRGSVSECSSILETLRASALPGRGRNHRGSAALLLHLIKKYLS